MLLEGTLAYDLSETFECGQAFRFVPFGNKGFRGVHKGIVLTLVQTTAGLLVDQYGGDLKASELRLFLDADRDYESLQRALINIEPALEEAVTLGSGIRLLKQEPFEALVSFVLSSNSNMKRIQTHIEKLSTLYGTLIGQKEGKSFYCFPTHAQLQKVPLEDFRAIGLGYRAEYLYELMASLSGEAELEALGRLETEALIKSLRQYKGIGEKVASCIALFGYGRHDAFPIDVWIKRYFERELMHNTWTLKQMEAYGREKYGPMAGLAQQYMFYLMLRKYKGH